MEIPLKARNKTTIPAIPLLGIYPAETKTEKDTCIPFFIAALFTIARIWKQPRCPSIDEWINRVTIYSLDVLLFLFGTSLLFHVQF